MACQSKILIKNDMTGRQKSNKKWCVTQCKILGPPRCRALNIRPIRCFLTVYRPTEYIFE